MVVEYEYRKGRLPKKGFSYPIKKTELDIALEEAGVTELKSVGLVSTKSFSLDKREWILGASMVGESEQGYWAKQVPRICVGAVPSNLKNEISELIHKKQVLKEVAKWLRELEGASHVRRDVFQKLDVYYRDGSLEIEKT